MTAPTSRLAIDHGRWLCDHGVMRRQLGIVALIVGALVLGAGVAAAQLAEEEPGKGQTKHLTSVAEAAGVTEAEIEALREDGAGWGEIRHGYALAEAEGIPVEEAIARIRNDEIEGPPPWAGPKKNQGNSPLLSEAKATGVPPGQLRQASRIAATTGLSPDEVLALKTDGVGWGQIRKAAALSVSDGLSLADALAEVQAAEPGEDGG